MMCGSAFEKNLTDGWYEGPLPILGSDHVQFFISFGTEIRLKLICTCLWLHYILHNLPTPFQ